MTPSKRQEIRFDGCEMIVCPKSGTIHRESSLRTLSQRIVDAIDQPRPKLLTDIIIDFNQITWISSVGLNELIQLQRRTRDSGVSLRLRALNTELREVFRITRLERIFEFEEPDSAAVETS